MPNTVSGTEFISPKVMCRGSKLSELQKVTLCGSRFMTGHEVPTRSSRGPCFYVTGAL